MSENTNIEAAIEAILFASGEPLEIKRLADVLDLDEKLLSEHMNTLKQRLSEDTSGIRLIKLKDKYQLVSKSRYAGLVRDIMDLKRNVPLSPAAMEVLSIVAYNEPVTKSFIEQVRGVDCSHIVGTLCLKGLLEERGRLQLPGKPIIYGTTPVFLRCFCLESLEDLPLPPEINEETGEESEKTANNTDVDT